MARPARIAGMPETRDIILAAAREEFSTRGLGARLEDIAARCGIKRPSLLHHFPTKQDLFNTLISNVATKTRARILMAGSDSQGDYATTIRRVTEEMRRLEQEERGLCALILQAITAPDDEYAHLREEFAQLLDVVTTLAMQAGAGRHHDAAIVRAAIAHLVMGELSRLAMGNKADRYWGAGDAIWPLTDAFFYTRTPV